jgi:transcriptional regulator with XRE-family HTH domain
MVSRGGDQVNEAIDKVADLGRDIGEYIRQQRNHAKISLRQLAKRAGVSNPYLSQIERGLRKPSAEILQQIARGLRISAEALYVQAGILDLPTGGPVVDAVRADGELTERQKQVLLDVYESFRRENKAARSTVEGSDVDSEENRMDPTRGVKQE